MRALRLVLIVQDDLRTAQAITALLPEGFRPLVARSVAEAQEAVDAGLRPDAAVVDALLPDGDGLDVVRSLRASDSAAPALLMTSLLSRTLVNDAQALRAELVCKPDYQGNLRLFFERLGDAVDHRPARSPAFEDVVEELALTRRERDVVWLSLNGVPRGRLAEVMGISENTIKKLVRSLLDKTHQSSLSEALWHVLLHVERRSA